MKLGEGFFSRKQKKASRLLQKIMRGFSPANSTSSFNMDLGMIDSMATAAMALLSVMRVGRYRR